MKPFNHKLHIFLSVITLGFWLIVYLPLYLISRKTPALSVESSAGDSEKKKLKEERKAKRAEALARHSRIGPKHLGYTKAKRGQMYLLACSHQIRAKQMTGLLSQGLLNKSVWCEICNDERQVTGQPSWVH